MPTPTPGETHRPANVEGLRVPFIANQGQVDARVAFYATTFAGTLFVTEQGDLVYSLPGQAGDAPDKLPTAWRAATGPAWTLTETFPGGMAQPKGHEQSTTSVSSFIGNDPARWRREIPTYEQVGLGEVWPGITVSLRARGRHVEKVFTVTPGGSVDDIRVRVSGARGLSVDPRGALLVRTGLGDVAFTPPVAYQERDGVRRPVAVAYRARSTHYGFVIGAYDRTRPVVIDPLLQSTYLGGGSDDQIRALAIHPITNDVYVAGFTGSTNFPGVAGGAQPTMPTADPFPARSAFVARLSRDLTTLVQATYLGGSAATCPNPRFCPEGDGALGLAIHPGTGDVYVAGFTSSHNFPGTSGGAQPALNGSQDAFVARLPSDLTTVIGATYLGGSSSERAFAMLIHPSTGDVYVAGDTWSSDFPGTAGAAQAALAAPPDVFVARLPSDLTSVTRATYLGGGSYETPSSLAADPATGDIVVGGSTASFDFPGTAGGAQPAKGSPAPLDGFVARLNGALTSLVGATYLGGSGDDVVLAVAVHPATGDVYAAGNTGSSDFPGVAGGAQPTPSGNTVDTLYADLFVARFTGNLGTLTQATFLGGSGGDVAVALAIHPGTGNVYVAGATSSPDFPGTAGGAQPSAGGKSDALIAMLTPSLTTLVRATYLGGTDNELASAFAMHAATGDVYVAGTTESTDFPGAAGGAQNSIGGGSTDGFVARLTSSLRAQLFADVPLTHPFLPWIEALSGAGITGGCATNPPEYCPDTSVTRGPMAVFLVRGIHGAGFDPPTATGTMFADVAASQLFASWIEQLARDGITGGCSVSPPLYCPDDGVTRGQIAVFLLRAKHGAGYSPPPATGTMFGDVPASHVFAPWIEQLAREGITGGCSTTLAQYCPDATVTRGQMAVFLVRAFNLPM